MFSSSAGSSSVKEAYFPSSDAAIRRCSSNRCSLKFRNIHKKTTALESLFSVAGSFFMVGVTE